MAIAEDNPALEKIRAWRQAAGEEAMATLARHVVNTRYEDLPEAARQAAKRDVFHIISMMLQGTRFPGCRPVLDFVRGQGGREEALVLNHGTRVPATSAALTGGMFAGIYDQDDCHDATACHCGPTVIPAALAMAQRQGKTAGKDLILAVALGNDVLLRLALPRVSGAGTTHITPSITFGVFGAAAAAGKFLELNEKQMLNGFGIAFSHGPIPIRAFMNSPKFMYGVRAAAGIFSAILAQGGVSGPPEILEASGGYWHAFEQAEVRPAEVTSELGTRFEGSNLSIKLYPVTRHAHGAVQAVLEMVQEYNIQPWNVTEIKVYGNAGVGHLQDMAPGQLHGILASLLGLAVVDREVTADNLYSYAPNLYTPNPYAGQESVSRPEVDEIAVKVKAFLDPDIANAGPKDGVGPVVAVLTTKDKVYSKRVDTAAGHHTKSPVSLPWLADEFNREARRAANPVPQNNIDAAAELLSNLEQLPDVTKIVELLG